MHFTPRPTKSIGAVTSACLGDLAVLGHMSADRTKKVDGDADRKGDGRKARGRPSLVAHLQPGELGLLDADGLGKLSDREALGLAGDSDAKSDGGVDVVHVSVIRETHSKKQASEVDIRIGRRVKARREAMGLRQIPFAKMLGVSQANLSRMESGAGWSAEQVSAACFILKCSPSDLMMETPPSEAHGRVLAALTEGDYMAAVQAVTDFFRAKP